MKSKQNFSALKALPDVLSGTPMTNEQKRSHPGFGDRLRKAREARSLSSSELARASGVSSTSVWKWENGGFVPRTQKLAVLAKVLNVSSDWLLRGQPEIGIVTQGASRPHGAKNRVEADENDNSLEELIEAINRKGFLVTITNRTGK